MTREEAIRLLSGLMFKGQLKKALDMAIKALEQKSFINKPCISEGVCHDSAVQKLMKIEQIYNSWRTGDFKSSTECMDDIGKVVEDGNDD